MLLEEKKKPWKSKTMIAGFIGSCVAFFKPELLDSLDQGQVLMAVSFIGMILRSVTKGKIALKE